MKKFGKFICKNKYIILIVSIILLILSFIGMKLTRINYDILVYLPKDIETIKGQNILTDDFNMGSYSMAIIDNMNAKEVLKYENKIKKVKGVNQVISIYDLSGNTIPLEMLPSELVSKVHSDDSTLLMITFNDSTSSEETINAVKEIREISDNKIKQGGMSSMVVDTMNLSEKEITIYIIIAVILCIIVLTFSLDSYAIPLILLSNIGAAIIFNLGTNILLGEISYITKALVAVLQLGVTTDFSIFLYNSYEKKKSEYKNNEKAMCDAIVETFSSVSGSALTTIAGFLVLCAMQLTLGEDLGIVMAKGVLLGVITVLTLFPSLLLIFDNLIEKTKHKKIIPNFSKLNTFIIKHHIAIFIIFILTLIPTYLAYMKVDVYYKLDKSLPNTLECIKANNVLKEKYNIVSPEILLIDKNLKSSVVKNMTKEISKTDGIDFVLSYEELQDIGISKNMISEDVLSIIENEKYQMILINSNYDIATDELNNQITEVNKIIKKYDKNAILAGEGPLMKDLIKICDKDFNNVNVASIMCIFIILFIVLKSFSLPFLLITTIEFAIFTNMSISYFDGSILPFIAPIVLGTIQLGATIDYAILMTTTYMNKRKQNMEKNLAMQETLDYCGKSIFVSGMCFFAATFGVGIYSDIAMIGTLCTLISRGALISMIVVIAVLPSILLIFDKLIIKTTYKGKEKNMKNKKIKACVFLLCLIGLTNPLNISALTKDETVYSKLDSDGSIKSTIVNEKIINTCESDTLRDTSDLENILNIGNDNTFSQKNNNITWDALGSDVYYQGNTDKKLPISTSIKYTLDGKTMSVKDMLGKSGKVTINIKYKNIDSHSVKINGRYQTLYTPFVITMATTLDSEFNKNITVNNGKVISNGIKEAIVGISTPGLYESLNINELKGLDTIKISYKTTKFELPTIYSIATPKLLDSNDTKIFDKMDSLYSSVNTLQKNMNKIDSSSKKLASGSNKLKTSLKTSINDLSKDNSDALSVEEINAIKNQTIKNVNKKFTNEYKNQIAITTWNTVKKELDPNDNTVTSYASSAVTNILASYLGGQTNLQYYGGCLQDNELACSALQAAGYDVNKVTEFKNMIAGQIGNVASKTSLYVAENVSKSVSIKVSQTASLETASEVSSTLAPTVANSVKNASISTITSSLNTLYSGVNELDNGISSLSKGISKFNTDGIAKVTSLVNGKLKTTTSKAKALIKLSNNYTSFTGSSNDDNETKFIFVIDSEKLEAKTNTIKKVEKNTTLWDRIKNLF